MKKPVSVANELCNHLSRTSVYCDLDCEFYLEFAHNNSGQSWSKKILMGIQVGSLLQKFQLQNKAHL